MLNAIRRASCLFLLRHLPPVSWQHPVPCRSPGSRHTIPRMVTLFWCTCLGRSGKLWQSGCKGFSGTETKYKSHDAVIKDGVTGWVRKGGKLWQGEGGWLSWRPETSHPASRVSYIHWGCRTLPKAALWLTGEDKGVGQVSSSSPVSTWHLCLSA